MRERAKEWQRRAKCFAKEVVRSISGGRWRKAAGYQVGEASCCRLLVPRPHRLIVGYHEEAIGWFADVLGAFLQRSVDERRHLLMEPYQSDMVMFTPGALLARPPPIRSSPTSGVIL